MHSITFLSPFDEITIFELNGKIVSLELGRAPEINPSELLLKAKKELCEYFIGKRKNFDLPLDIQGTDFQKKVFEQMLRIPYGKTKSYKEIAKIINSSPRAVGNACGKNPIPIIVPCHRVISSNNKIGGFSGFYGIDSKKILLNLEGYDI